MRFSTGRRVAFLLLIVVASAASTALAAGPVGKPYPTRGGDPILNALVASAPADAARTAPTSLSALAQRTASASAFRNLSDRSALAAVRSEQPLVVDSQPWDALALKPGDTIREYRGRYDAVIGSGPGGASNPQFLESTWPLRATDATGSLAPIDMALRAVPAGFAAVNPEVDLAIPADLSAGIALGKNGPRLEIGGLASTRGAGVQAGNDVFYANTMHDADTVLRPSVRGFEQSTILRSPDSPEEVALNFALPSTMQLMASSRRGVAAEIGSGTQTVAGVSVPTAVDAQGQPVPVSYSVAAGRMTVAVPHRRRGFAYPIVVDPEVYTWETTGDANTNGWTYTGDASRFSPYFGGGYLGNGWYLRNLFNNAWYYANEAGYLYYTAQAGARITWATFSSVKQDLPINEVCMFWGLMNPGGNWQAGGVGDPPAVGTRCQQESGFAASVVTSEQITGNSALWGSMTRGDGYRNYYMQHLGGVTLVVQDVDVPTVEITEKSDWWITDPNTLIRFTGRDAGLGIADMGITIPDTPGWAGSAPDNLGCSGGFRSPCPASYTITRAVGNLSDGFHALSVYTDDASPKRTTIYPAIAIDRNGPSASLSGSLWNARGTTVNSEVPLGMHVDAADGASGVERIWMTVDGVETNAVSGCGQNGCSQSADWSVQPASLAPGNHTLKILTRDRAGNVSERGSWGVSTWSTSSAYGGADQTVNTDTERESVANAIITAASSAARAALWQGLRVPERTAYIDYFINDAVLNRANYGMDATVTNVRALFTSPDNQVTLRDYGAPLTPAELASWEPTSPPPGPETITPPTGTTAQAAAATNKWFNRAAAVADADAHAGEGSHGTFRTGLFAPISGTDCTNYISQAWYFGGGLRMTKRWHIAKRFFGLVTDLTPEWAAVTRFVDYMVNDRQIARLITATPSASRTSGTAGDAVEYDWGETPGTDWSHLALLVKTGGPGDDLIDQHSNSRWHKPWRYGYLTQGNASFAADMHTRVVHVNHQ